MSSPPPFATFGAHEGDGACYGYWVDWEGIDDSEHEGSLLKVPAGEDWPEDEVRERLEADALEYVLEASERGSATLFDARTRKEVWSIV